MVNNQLYDSLLLCKNNIITNLINMKITKTPIGYIASLDNDWYTMEIQNNGQYAEQINIDGILKPIIESSKVMLDIGSHVGYHSIAYAKMNPNVKVIAFEPQPEIYSLLTFNVKENGYEDRISTMNVCVGHKEIKTTLGELPKMHIENIYNMGGRGIGDGETNTNMITIDSLNLDRVDYMKIDVEGAEHLVIAGAEQTIRKFKPIIYFEDLNRLDTGFLEKIEALHIPDAYQLLRDYGYNNFQNVAFSNVIATI
jgi:FkbM family methyltransferase